VGVTTGCLSQALSVSASITDTAENKIVCFMVIPLYFQIRIAQAEQACSRLDLPGQNTSDARCGLCGSSHRGG
jgi:hypothetical protein